MNASVLSGYDRNPLRHVPATFIVFILAESAAISAAAVLDASPYLPALIAGILLLTWSIQRPHIWIFFVIISHVIMLERSEGITVGEVVFGVYFLGVLAWWFATSFLKGEKIFVTFADKCILVFFGLCVLSVIPALANQADPVKWFRELLIFVPYLLYFPLRKWILTDRRVLLSAGLGFLVFSLLLAVNNFLKYKAGASSVIYAWQLVSGRQAANEPLFLAAIIVGVALFLYAKKFRDKALLLSLISFFCVALIITFSRGYWLGLVVGFLSLAVVLKRKGQTRLVAAVSMLVGFAVVIVSTGFGFLGSSILQSIPERLVSASFLSTDVSFLSRVAESEAALRVILDNPIIGNGLGTVFRFHDPILRSMHETWYTHNGYIFLWMKTGLIGLIAYLLAYFAMVKSGVEVYRNSPLSFEGHLAAGIVSVLVAMLLVSLTSPQFTARDSILIITVGWALIDAAEMRSQKSINATHDGRYA